MITIEISQTVYDAIAAEGVFGEVPDDVLRRKYDLPKSAGPIPAASGSGRSNGGGQTTATGRRGGQRGRSETARAAKYIGAEKTPGKQGNQYTRNNERLLLKWAKYGNGRIGIYDGGLEQVDYVVGVLETADGDRELWKVSAADLEPYGKRSVAHENQMQFQTRTLREIGELIGTITDDVE